jgi:hypothetical protein
MMCLLDGEEFGCQREKAAHCFGRSCGLIGLKIFGDFHIPKVQAAVGEVSDAISDYIVVR